MATDSLDVHHHDGMDQGRVVGLAVSHRRAATDRPRSERKAKGIMNLYNTNKFNALYVKARKRIALVAEFSLRFFLRGTAFGSCFHAIFLIDTDKMSHHKDGVK
jgi:hypothetical protein